MNKPKNFFFTLVIAIIMLFILGNWVTSVQATNIAFGATPVPTNTPSYPPDTPPGEVPSVEKQEELKAVVHMMVIHVIESTFLINFFSWASSVIGLALGMIGATFMAARRHD